MRISLEGMSNHFFNLNCNRECQERFELGEFLISSSSGNSEPFLQIEIARPPSRVENPQVNDQEFQKMNAYAILDSKISHKVMHRIGAKQSLFEQVF
jgi:hypothetical protein